MNALRVLRATVVAAVAATVLVVSGCSTADTAAVVDGRRITETQVQEAVTQLKKVSPDANITTTFALRSLIYAPFVTQVADQAGKGISDSYAAQLIGANPVTSTPTRSTWSRSAGCSTSRAATRTRSPPRSSRSSRPPSPTPTSR